MAKKESRFFFSWPTTHNNLSLQINFEYADIIQMTLIVATNDKLLDFHVVIFSACSL